MAIRTACAAVETPVRERTAPLAVDVIVPEVVRLVSVPTLVMAVCAAVDSVPANVVAVSVVIPPNVPVIVELPVTAIPPALTVRPAATVSVPVKFAVALIVWLLIVLENVAAPVTASVDWRAAAPDTVRLVKVPTLVIAGCAAFVTVPAVVAVLALPDTLPVSEPVRLPEKLPTKVVAEMVPAEKSPALSRATIALAVLLAVAVVAELETLPAVEIVAR